MGRHPHVANHRAGHHTAAPVSLNAGMTMSPAGRAALSAREGQGGTPGNIGGHYDDSAQNCTVGIGILVHMGPCTAAELAQRADDKANATEFNTRVREAERRVIRSVPNRRLNQNQFDALVSATFNSGGGIVPTLAQADKGNDAGVAMQLRNLVKTHNHDKNGHVVGPAVISKGLVNRRASEISQYNKPASPTGKR